VGHQTLTQYVRLDLVMNGFCVELRTVCFSHVHFDCLMTDPLYTGQRQKAFYREHHNVSWF